MELLRSLTEARLNRHMIFDGLDISIEVPADGYRRGVSKHTGEQWAIKVPAHYGYIKGTHSPDGEHLDCYVRKNPRHNAKVYVIHQLTPDGSRFDEDKVMLGYGSKQEAIRTFKSVTFKPNVMYGGCTEFDMEHFQVAAYSSSKSHTMLTTRDTYSDFKKRGYLSRNIKSPIMVARRVSESLREGLSEISDTLLKGDLLECLEWGGVDEDLPVDVVIDRAYEHYAETPYMIDAHPLSEEEFRDTALKYMMETDALLTDVEDDIHEEINEDTPDLGQSSHVGESQSGDQGTDSTEELSEDSMTENNFVVVIHTQIMENIGTADLPQWATAGSKTQLVQEGFHSYGDARAVAARVSSGEIPVELAEGAYVLGIDVMPLGEYRQFHEDDNAEPEAEEVVEDTTDDVFFAQQVQETRQLAGIRDTSDYENRGTPSVHETRERLEALTQEFYEGLEAEQLEEAQDAFPVENLAHAMDLIEATKVKNPQATTETITKAICKKVYGDVSLSESLLEQARLLRPEL